MTAIFGKDLAYGQAAESEFHLLFPKLERLDGRRADFKTTEGFLVEIKSDRYNPKTTSNYFFERYSFASSDGGPFQSRKNGVDIFCYWFPLTQEVNVFSVKDLCAFLEENYTDDTLRKITNETYITRGWIVPRSSVEHLKLSAEVLK